MLSNAPSRKEPKQEPSGGTLFKKISTGASTRGNSPVELPRLPRLTVFQMNKKFTEPNSACTLDLERKAWATGWERVAGIDEAGRGALAGPVVAAAVILPRSAPLPDLDDSKRLRPSQREALFEQLSATGAAIGTAQANAEAIDNTNVLHASLAAMVRAAQALSPPPDYLLIDGNRFVDDSPWPFSTVIGGDGRSMSVAAASIVAKCTRDEIMRTLHEEYPWYSWKTNMGYPTQLHYKILGQRGPSPYHRKSFRLR